MSSIELPAATSRTALIVGATGGIGSAVAQALIRHGWKVRGLARDLDAARRGAAWVGPMEWVKGDAMRAADVLAAAAGADVVFHGANPPQYKNWRGPALPMLRNSIAAAREVGARLIFPGTLYNFGPDAGPLVGEASPQHPLTRKGAIRVEMERMLAAAARDDGLRVLVVRAGDYFGLPNRSSWYQAVVRAGQPVTSVTYPGKPEIGHAWAYLPDLAETIARLADIEATLPVFDSFHFGGHWLERGIEIAEATRRVASRPDLPIRRMPWWLFYLAAPFVTFMREALEMRYLWQRPLRLDNGKLRALIGEEPHTDLDTALRHTLAALGCQPLGQQSPTQAANAPRPAGAGYPG